MTGPITLSALYKDLREQIEDFEARWVIQERTGHGWADILARPDSVIEKAQQDLMRSDVRERQAGKPLSRLYGRREFWGLDFKLSPDTLDPRPDSETIIEVALQKNQGDAPAWILDLGTGTGCLPIALLTEWPEAQAVAVDLAGGAVRTAQDNANMHGVEDRFFCVQGSWADSLDHKFDLIVANPPYIPNQEIANLGVEVQKHDPILALKGGEDGLDPYRAIFTEIERLLKAEGTALFEIGFDQAEDVSRIAKNAGLSVRHVHPDLAGLKRVVEISCGDK